MATCTACGNDVTGKKFCQQCGTPVQPGNVTAQQAQTTTCSACHEVVPADNAFCVNCGNNLHPTAAPQATSAPAFCNNCGKQNAPGVRFCAGCGSPLAATAAHPTQMQSGQYPPSQYSQPQYQSQAQYGQSQNPQYPQNPQQYGQPQYPQNPQYGQYQQYPQQYGQGGYQQQPMMGQQPMVLRCPVCQAMAPMGTPNCVSCRTSLAGVVPTPANIPVSGQQGSIGGFLQGSGGQMAMGALGGAAAVIGGEMLLHGLEGGIANRVEGDMGYGYEHRGHHRDEGLLGGLGEIGNDLGLL